MSNLLAIKKEILAKFEREWNLHVKSIVPQEAIDNELTIGSLVRDFGGDMEKYLESLKQTAGKRGRKKAAPKLTAKSKKAATAKKVADAGENTVVRRSRRITLKGLGVNEDVELSLYTSNNNDYEQDGSFDQDESIELENLDTAELLKMRDALRLAEQKASKLLANLGH